MLRETGVCQWVDTARWKWHLFCIQHPRDNEYPLLIRHDNGKFARLWMMFPFTCLFSLRIPRPSMLDDTGLDVFQCNPLLCGRVAEGSVTASGTATRCWAWHGNLWNLWGYVKAQHQNPGTPGTLLFTGKWHYGWSSPKCICRTLRIPISSLKTTVVPFLK